MSAFRSPLLLLSAVLGLTACGSSTLTVYLNSSESEGPVRAAASEPDTTLAGARQVRLTIASVGVHLASILAREPDAARELGWVEVLPEPLTVDLMNVRGQQVRRLGEGVLPSGNSLSQIRLRLQAPGEAVDGWYRLPAAIVEAGDTTCDLLVPAAAVDPGLTLPETLSLSDEEGHLDVVISVRLDSARRVHDDTEACSWELEPVLHLRPLLGNAET